MTRKICLGCLAVMVAAALSAYPLSMIGWEAAAGAAFILAMVTSWIVAVVGATSKLWRG
ncbi:MAG: hypothetical protein ACKO1O_05590 [Erythrobacter sp.]